RGFFRFWIFWNPGSERKISARVKRRINVDKINFPRELRQQRRQHVLLVTPNQTIAPLFLTKSRTEQKSALPVLGRFVDRLNGLERQCHAERRDPPTVSVVLALPHQLGACRSPRCWTNCVARSFLVRGRFQ